MFGPQRRARSALALVFLLLGVCVLSCPGRLAGETLTILYTNDVHGHLLPFSYPDPPDSGSALAHMPARRDIGGMARCATLVGRIRGEQGRQTLLFDAGDILDGTPFSVVYHGRLEVDVMNAIGYDAMTLGNHEFNLTYAQFDSLLAAPRFHALAANIRSIVDDAPRLESHVILPAGALRVGVFGLTTPSTAGYPGCKGRYEVLPPIATAREMVARLQKEKAHLIVALTHLGIEGELALADSVPAIDVIVGGHSHTRLASPRVVRRGRDLTLIVQAHQWCGELGRLDLEVDHQGEDRWAITGFQGCLLPVDAEIPEKREVAELIRRAYEPMRATYEEVLGKAAADFANVGFERATVNLVADAMREAAGVEIALQNYGGVRDSFFRGPIRMWEVASMLPFENAIVVLRMNGGRLRRGLEDERETLGPSGMRLVWRESRLASAEVNGVALDSTKAYTVATNSYIHDKLFADVPLSRTLDRNLRDIVVDYIRRGGTIHPLSDGRTQRIPN